MSIELKSKSFLTMNPPGAWKEVVYLVDAQKEIKKYKLMGFKDCFRANMLEAKIEAANKILDDESNKIHTIDFTVLERLRMALENPRKEQRYPEGVKCSECGADADYIGKDDFFCKQCGRPTKRKENTTP